MLTGHTLEIGSATQQLAATQQQQQVVLRVWTIVVEPAAFFLRQKPMQKTYEQQIQECQVLLLVDFCTVWCGPCQLQAKVINNVTPLYTGKVEFLKVDTEKHAAISAQYGIHSLPTLILFRGGEVVERKEGLMNEIDLRLWLQKHL
ncbi:hypothetical protein N2152v2_006995 [Parachlorella kessleri]